MRAKFAWALTLVIGVILVGWFTLVIGDIDLKARNADVTNTARFTGFQGANVLTTGESSFIDIDEPPRGTRYVELKLAEISGPINITVYDNYDNIPSDNISPSEIPQTQVTNGRNFINLRGEYQSIRLSFEPNLSFKLSAIRLSERLPLRTRHILAFTIFLIAWIAFVIFAGKRRNISLAQVIILRKYTYLLINLVKMDFTTKYRRSLLGVLWSVLNPLLMMIVMSTVFSKVFRIAVANYPVFYLTGTLIFSLMSEATSSALRAIDSSAELIKKVYIPKYIFPVEKCVFALVNTAFSFVAVLILTPLLGVPLRPTVFLCWVPILYTFIFSVGFGMVLAAVNVFFKDIGHLYGVLITAWNFLTPVIYSVEAVPAEVQRIFAFNPMYYYVSYFRDVMMYNTIPDLRLNLICIAFSVSFLIIGLVVFKAKQDKFILYI
jgi:ABC-2 type transport system permease protein